LNENKPEEGMWKMYFDGASSWEGDGAGILLISPSGKLFHFLLDYSLKLIPQ
jgi:hypothetical protein